MIFEINTYVINKNPILTYNDMDDAAYFIDCNNKFKIIDHANFLGEDMYIIEDIKGGLTHYCNSEDLKIDIQYIREQKFKKIIK